MSKLLNHCLCNELREVINKTDIFIQDEEESKKFLLICALMDRFDTAVKYINEHQKTPKTEEELIIFIVYSCIIKDGVEYIKRVLGISKSEDRKVFEEIYRSEPINIGENQDFDDDRFFEYFRSLVFAHPLSTNRSIPNPVKDERQYSPYIVMEPIWNTSFRDPIGAKVYSNKREIMPPVLISFNELKEYIKYKFEEINDVIEEFQNIIDRKETEWKKRKVNRNQSSIDILKECKEILKERYIEYDNIEELINNLSCKSSIKENEKSIKRYKDAIIKIIPDICDALDNYNIDDVYDIVSTILYVRPNAHPMMNYQLEKIFGHLNNEYEYGYTEWGLIQAEAFSKEFAKKWVIIKPREMDFDEIKMLANVACYLEYMEQKEGRYE